MATSRDAPNPLRPYYIPPSIGLPVADASNASAPAPSAPSYSTSYSSSSPSYPSGSASFGGPSSGSSSNFSTRSSFGSQARDILSDLDYDSYFADSSPTLAEHARRVVDQALWNYTSVLLAQPFEVAKTILQIAQAGAQDGRVGGASVKVPGLRVNGEDVGSGRGKGRRPESWASGGKYEDYPSDYTHTSASESDSDSPSYFTSTAPNARPHRRRSRSRSPNPPYSPSAASSTTSHSYSRRRRHTPSHSNTSTPTQSNPGLPHRSYALTLSHSSSLLEVISQLWAHESAWGVWKATNVTFVYNFLLKTSESWIRSLLAAVLNIPDPGLVGAGAGGSGIGGLDIVDSNSPLLSLSVAVAAAGIAAAVLAPLDLVRTRLIVTPVHADASTSSKTGNPRTIWPALRSLRSWTLGAKLASPTLLHATLPTLISSSTPLLLRSTFAIDPVGAPSMYSFATFASSVVELFVRLPVETVLRRGQVAVLAEEGDAVKSVTERERWNSLPSASRGARGEKDKENEKEKEKDRFQTIITPGPYKGVLGTMWFIARDEGVQVLGAPPMAHTGTPQQQQQRGANGFPARQRVRKGQGMQGLWRGWRVGFWGLVGVWGAAALGGGGGEF